MKSTLKQACKTAKKKRPGKVGRALDVADELWDRATNGGKKTKQCPTDKTKKPTTKKPQTKKPKTKKPNTKRPIKARPVRAKKPKPANAGNADATTKPTPSSHPPTST